MAAIKALEQWCRVHCEGYRDVAITNMTTSFRSGLAFCALIHKYRPDLIDYESLRKEDVFENNRLAFQVAEEKLGIPALLDAEDMVALRIPDRLSILTYVSQYYNYFNGRPPMGGVKRPADGYREEPSEKKNLPVVAKSFVPKATENWLPSTHLAAQTSTKVAGAAVQNVQKAAPAENANKSASLSSKCAACRSHVHLVQRHFMEGKLYHRSCFRCSECSNVLHAGGYKPGTRPGTFICNAHQEDCKPVSKNGPTGPTGPIGPVTSARKPRPSSVLLAPVDVAVVKPVSPTPLPEPWTASAQRTQSARQKFFQAAAPADRKHTEVCRVQGRPEIPESPEEEPGRAGRQGGKNLAAGNRSNNNNKRPFTIRSAGRRFGDEPRSAEKSGRGPAGNGTGRPSTSQPSQKEAPGLHQVNKDASGPTAGLPPAKGFRADHLPADLAQDESQSNLTLLKTDFSQKGSESEGHEHGAVGPSDLRSAPVRPPQALPPQALPPPQAPPSCLAPPPLPAVFGPAQRGPAAAPCRPPRGPEKPAGAECGRSSAKSAPRRPAAASEAPESSSSANHGTPSGAKKGKYLSPTNASRTEMRSPSVRSHHVPAEQIERQLQDIESSLAQLEKDGVELERKLRHCEEDGDGDLLMDPLMVDWFNLIRQKQAYIRKESELVYIARTQELEQQQPGVEEELRRLLEKPDHLKSRVERRREETLMWRLVEIVDGRNAIVEGLDEDRRREEEEDQQLNEMMKNLRVKKPKPKRTSSISKMFRRRSKRGVE